jgi:hypothetical protein
LDEAPGTVEVGEGPGGALGCVELDGAGELVVVGDVLLEEPLHAVMPIAIATTVAAQMSALAAMAPPSPSRSAWSTTCEDVMVGTDR